MSNVLMQLNRLAQHIHNWARRKKWWEVDFNGKTVVNRPPLELLMLVVTEAAEAAEEARHPEFDPLLTYAGKDRVPYQEAVEHANRHGQPLPKPEGFGIELADIIIRCLDTATAYGINIEEAVARKLEYNETRPERHGGKRA